MGQNRSIRCELLKNATSISGLTREGKALQKDFIYVADSKLVTETNLKELGTSDFITRLPAIYNEHSGAITQAIEEDKWEDIGVLSETVSTKKRPAAYYRINEQEIVLYGQKYRALVVHSSAHDKRRKKKLEDQKMESLQKAKKQIQEQNQTSYACLEDAQKALEKNKNRKFSFHSIVGEVETVITYERGRPAEGQERRIKSLSYKLNLHVQEEEARIKKSEKETGCFVLMTNVPTSGKNAHSSKYILQTYKEQHGIERNFSFLKNPKLVNSLFLKKPQRIEALGLVLLLALMVANLIQLTML